MPSYDRVILYSKHMPADEPSKPWTSVDEYDLQLEVSEDRRLRELGIDPDQNQLEIWMELRRRADKIDAERAERKKKSHG
jgi:hypothetical protein